MSAVVWIVAVAAVVAACAWFVVWFVKRSNAKYAAHWATVAPLVQGSYKGSTLTGTYEGMAVKAQMKSVSSQESSTEHYFQLTLTGTSGGKDWSLRYGTGGLLGGRKGWEIKAKDDGLERRLSDAAVVATIEAWARYPAIAYRAKSGALEYKERARGMFDLPDAATLKGQLELLARLHEVNRQVNPAA